MTFYMKKMPFGWLEMKSLIFIIWAFLFVFCSVRKIFSHVIITSFVSLHWMVFFFSFIPCVNIFPKWMENDCQPFGLLRFYFIPFSVKIIIVYLLVIRSIIIYMIFVIVNVNVNVFTVRNRHDYNIGQQAWHGKDVTKANKSSRKNPREWCMQNEKKIMMTTKKKHISIH